MINGQKLAELLDKLKAGDLIQLLVGYGHIRINQEVVDCGMNRLLAFDLNDVERKLQLIFLMGMVVDAALRLRGLTLSAFSGLNDEGQRIEYFSTEHFQVEALQLNIDRGRMMKELKALNQIIYRVAKL